MKSVQEYLKGTEATEQIKESFNLLNDLVSPSMGARGRMAIIAGDWGQPLITDDGVTIVRALNNLSGWHKEIGKSVIEAAKATEAEAFDGTTLTVLLTAELFNHGQRLIDMGMHPRIVVDEINKEIKKILSRLEEKKLKMTPELVQAVATIATKIPEMAPIIQRVYDIVGKGMDATIEWNRDSLQTTVVHEKGYTIRGGYMDETLAMLGTTFTKCKIALMKTGLVTELQLTKWFESFPEEKEILPIIYVISPGFDPQAMRKIIAHHGKNQLVCQFLFLNTGDMSDIMLDIQSLAGGKIQDSLTGIKNYTYSMCGQVNSLSITKTKTVISGDGDTKDRIAYYKKNLKDLKFQNNSMEKFLLETKLASLDHGIATIKVGVPTQAAFTPVKLKLDDAKGAVYMAFKEGVVLGAGKTLKVISRDTSLRDVMEIPYLTIMKNAGIKSTSKLKDNEAMDVTTGKPVNLLEAGIIDSLASIKRALINATSIATNYLTAYMIIKNKPIDKKEPLI